MMGKFIYSGLVVLLLASCLPKDEFVPGQQIFPGKISAVQNGESWSAPMELIVNTDSITNCPAFLLRSLDRNSAFYKHLGLGYLSPTWERQTALTISKYSRQFHPENNYPSFSTSQGGDVPSTRYQGDTVSLGDFVQFAYYDARQKRLFGAFRLSFDLTEKISSSYEPNVPDRREFREGVFSVKLAPELIQCFQ